MSLSAHIYALVAALLPVMLLSCSEKEHAEQPDGSIVVSVGDSVLTVAEVEMRIPRGIDPQDSVEMFKAIADAWVMDLVLADVAERNLPDPERIQKMVDAYRNGLIINEYLKSMSERAASDPDESDIRKYYDSHRDEFILTQPLVRGAYLKVAETDASLPDLRQWMSQFSDESVDKIEKGGLKHASAYRYFRDEWIEWNAIADQIPYRFFDADAFVSATRNFETAADGSAYILHISDYLLSGSEMPYEVARLKILEILRTENIREARQKLINEIYGEKVKSGLLRSGNYDPLKREFTTKPAIK